MGAVSLGTLSGLPTPPSLTLPALPSPARAHDASRELTVTETLDEYQAVAAPMLSGQTRPHLHNLR